LLSKSKIFFFNYINITFNLGARRDPENWTEKDTRTSWLVNRGYTRHEHLDAFGIINMNGRVYDPFTAQFFFAEPCTN